MNSATLNVDAISAGMRGAGARFKFYLIEL